MRKLVFMALLFSSCYYHNNIEGSGLSYLPLEVGNWWDFGTVHREVVRTFYDKTDGYRYYLLVTHSNARPPALPIRPDSAYYRIDNNGYVYILRNHQTFADEQFRLNAQEGDTWTYPVDGKDSTNVTVTIGPLQIGNKELTNCKSYYTHLPNWADDGYTMALAPGIGFVKEYRNSGGWSQDLTSAKIHGVVYTF